MAVKTFRRKETKYVAEPSRLASFLSHANELSPDATFPASHIVSVYFDTPGHDVIERSLEKPKYKEKLRARFYGESPETCFIELKKKYKGVVYKRRIALPADLFSEFTSGSSATSLLSPNASWQEHQIAREIDAYRSRLTLLRPSFAIAASRSSYSSDDMVRITVDDGIWYKVLDQPGGLWRRVTAHAVMEVKAAGAYPLWLAEALSHEKLFPGSFSKYGTAYKREQGELPSLPACLLPEDFDMVADICCNSDSSLWQDSEKNHTEEQPRLSPRRVPENGRLAPAGSARRVSGPCFPTRTAAATMA